MAARPAIRARLGPIRSWMAALCLRSAQVSSAPRWISASSTTTTLSRMIRTSVHTMPSPLRYKIDSVPGRHRFWLM